MHKSKSVKENETHTILWDFQIQTDHLISYQKTRPSVDSHGQRTCRLVDFAVPTDHIVKIKESEKVNKYCDLAREPKKLWVIIFIQPLRSCRIWHKVNFLSGV